MRCDILGNKETTISNSPDALGLLFFTRRKALCIYAMYVTYLSQQTHFYVEVWSLNKWCVFFMHLCVHVQRSWNPFISVILVAGMGFTNLNLLGPNTRVTFCGLPSMSHDTVLFDVKQWPPICGCRCDPPFKTRHDWVKTKTKVFFSPFPFQNFLASTSCPEIQGYLYVKELGRKSWKKVYMFLRRSGLYCSTKGTSKVTSSPFSSPAGWINLNPTGSFCVIVIITVIIYHFQPHTHPTSHFIPMVSVIFQIKHNYLQRVFPLLMCPLCMHPHLSAPPGGFSLWSSDLLINSVSRSQGIYS